MTIWRCDLVPQYEAYKKEINRAAQRVLSSGRYILGKEVEAFEKEFASYLGAKYAVGVANATDGLTISLKSLGVGRGDEVITTPYTAIPTISAIIASGARPVFVDVNRDTFLMDIGRVKKALTGRTRAVMPVHLFGNVVDIPALKSVVGKVPVVEDSAQAHGSALEDMKAGAMGNAGVFSFYPTKNLGGYGDGGAVVTDDPALAGKARLLRMYGMVDKDHTVLAGVNSRLDEMQAAFLRVKLARLDEMNRKRNAIAKRYRKELDRGLFSFQAVEDGVYSNYHVFEARCRMDRKVLIRYLSDHGIQTNIYYPIPLHLQEAYGFLGYRKGDFPNAELLSKETIALPLYPELKPEQQGYIIKCLNKFAAKKRKMTKWPHSVPCQS